MESKEIIQEGIVLDEDLMDVFYSTTQNDQNKRVNRLVEVGELSQALKVANRLKRFELDLPLMNHSVAQHHQQYCANRTLYWAAKRGDKFARKFIMRQGPVCEILGFDGKIEKKINDIYENGLSEKDPAALYAKAMTLLTSDDWDEENEGRVLLIESADEGDGHAIAKVVSLNLIEREHDSALSWAKEMEKSEDTEALVQTAAELIGWRKFEQGISLLRVASERENSDALTLLGEVADISGDTEYALYLWKKAANSGDPHAMRYLAKGEVRNKFNLPITNPEVLGTLHRSARLGSLNSYNILTENYSSLTSSIEVTSRECCAPELWEEKYDDCIILHEDHSSDEDFLRAYWYEGACAGNVFAQIQLALALQWDSHKDAAGQIFDNLIHAGQETAAELITRVLDLEYVEEKELVELAVRLYPRIVRVPPIRIYMKSNNMEFPDLTPGQ